MSSSLSQSRSWLKRESNRSCSRELIKTLYTEGTDSTISIEKPLASLGLKGHGKKLRGPEKDSFYVIHMCVRNDNEFLEFSLEFKGKETAKKMWQYWQMASV